MLTKFLILQLFYFVQPTMRLKGQLTRKLITPRKFERYWANENSYLGTQRTVYVAGYVRGFWVAWNRGASGARKTVRLSLRSSFVIELVRQIKRYEALFALVPVSANQLAPVTSS